MRQQEAQAGEQDAEGLTYRETTPQRGAAASSMSEGDGRRDVGIPYHGPRVDVDSIGEMGLLMFQVRSSGAQAAWPNAV